MHKYQKKMLVDCTDSNLEIRKFSSDNVFYHGKIKTLVNRHGTHGAVRVIDSVGFCYFDDEEDKETTSILLGCGGFFAASLKDEKLSEFYRRFTLPRNIKAIVVMHVPTLMKTAETMVQFILIHEYAHIKLGHLSLNEERRAVEHKATGAPRIELAADLYAAYAVGIATSINLLRSTRKMFASAFKVAPQIFDLTTNDGKLIRKGLCQIAGRISSLQEVQRKLTA